MFARLPVGFIITEDEKDSWSKFEDALQSRYKISIPGKRFDIWAPAYVDTLLEELSEKYEHGHALAAWRALHIACSYRRAVPSWVSDHFSRSLSVYLEDRNLQALVGSTSKSGTSQAEQMAIDYVRARRYAALIVSDYAGNTGDERWLVAQSILTRQGVGRGRGRDSFRASWTEIKKTAELGLISSVEFIEMLYSAWFIHRRLITGGDPE